MTILEINSNKPTTPETIELTETAEGRFFYDKPQEVWTDFTPHQLAIGRAARCLREKGIEGAPYMVKPLEGALKEIETAIKNHEGFLVMAVDSPRKGDFRTGKLVENYVQHQDENTTVLFIPRERIAAVSGNPQLYGSGTDVMPVLNICIQTDSDTLPEQECPGTWYKIDLENVPLALVDDIR
jgi:hypothetical protein